MYNKKYEMLCNCWYYELYIVFNLFVLSSINYIVGIFWYLENRKIMNIFLFVY